MAFSDLHPKVYPEFGGDFKPYLKEMQVSGLAKAGERNSS
jgi:hypothetical protein